MPIQRLTVAAWLVALGWVAAAPPVVPLTGPDGFRIPVVAGSCPEPVKDLTETLGRMTGFDLSESEAPAQGPGLYVGLAMDFPEFAPSELKALGPEGCWLETRIDGSLLLLGNTPRGVQHAVSTFLQHLGCRWYFPGKTWEVIPRKTDLRVAFRDGLKPSFPTQRRIWYGFGAEARSRADLEAWNRRNRMGGSREIRIHHSWYGLDPEKDFPEHPDWFAEVEGKRQPSKPCYSHPEVTRRAIAQVRAQIRAGADMVSLSAPDGLGYCHCATCMKVAEGAETFTEKNVLFARKPEGVVGITSENLFAFVNRVAEAVEKESPSVLLGCYAYSAYAHPPTFGLRSNVYVQCTTAYRRTPLSLEEQLAAFGRKSRELGIREYFSVFQWDWDEPVPGKLIPDRLQETLRFYRDEGVTAINAESSNNWGPRGLGYYLAAQWMWDADADREALLRDFYQTAFGPAALPMQRYYTRWYGASAWVLGDPTPPPSSADPNAKNPVDIAFLRGAAGDLARAVSVTEPGSPERARVDDLRMYLHYLVLRGRLVEAEATGDRDRILRAIEAETAFGGQLTYTGLVHSRALVGKGFLRRFRKHRDLLESLGENPLAHVRKKVDAPSVETFEPLWREDLRFLKASP